MTEQEYKQTLNLIENSVFANMPLQWVETFQPGIGQMIANIEREVTEWADLNAPVWAVDPLQSGTYNAVKSELLAFAQNLQKYKDDPARSEVIYDFINAARSLYSFNKNYGLDRTPLTNAENPFKLSIVSSRVATFGYMYFKNLANLVKFNEDLLASIDSEKIQLKDHTKTVLEPVREKLYKLITEDPEFKTLLEELGYGEADDFIQSFAPGNGVLESLTDEFFSNFNTFVGNISARLDTERQTTDLAIAEARADAQESIDDALGRIDQLVADLSTYQTGINTQIQTIESAYESLNTIVQSNVSRIGATESAIIQEATTRADGFTATAARIDGMVSRIDAVDASILQEANTRASEDAATADRIDQLVTRVDDNAAAIINEQNARTTALLAEATARETLAAQLKSDSELYASGLVTSEANVRAAQDEVLGERIDLVSAEVGGISTAILNEQTARITGDAAEATSRKALSTKLFGTDVIDGVTVDTLTSGFLYDQQQSIITQTESVVTAATGQIAQIQTDLTNTKADLLTETTTRVNEYGAIATSVTVLSTEVNNQKATLDSLNSIVSGPDGITTQWGIKSDINGYITGVGLISSSKYGTPTSQFIVYADQFALVTPGVNGGQPTLPFFVGSEQGYLELSNTVKSNWNNITGSNKPADNATRNVFRGDWAASISYAVGDIVLKDGNGWSCILAHTSSSSNQPPASGSGNTWWTLYAVKGSDGAQGLHALTVLVPNNAHTLPAASDGVVASYTGSGTTIQVFEGTTALSAVSSITANGQFTVGTPTQVPASTITVGARSYAGTTATVAQHSAMAAGTDSVVVTYPITVRRTDGTTVSLSATQTLTKSKAGAKGDAGESAKAAFLAATSQVFQIAKSGTITPSSITLTATGQNVTGSPTFSVTSGTATLTGTGNTRTLASTELTTDAATIKIAWDGQEDYVTVVKVREGADGTSGANAIVAVLSNEAHTVPTDSTGNNGVFTGANTTMTIYNGTADDSANWTVTATVSNVTGSLLGKTYTVTGLSADTGYVDLTAARSGYASIVKRFVLTKSKAGVAGAQGPAGPAVVVTANRALSFTATDGALDGSQADIVLTASVSGITSPTYVWTFSGLQTNPTASTTSSQTITAAQFGTSKAATVTCTVNGSFVDQVTIVRLEKSTAAPWATAGSNLGTDLSRWVIGSQTLVTVTDGKVGNTVLRLGTAVSYPTQTSFVPIDPTKKYRVRFWARPSADCNGLLYFSLRQAVNETDTWGPVNGGRAPYKPSGQTRASHNATYGTDAWGEYSYIWSAADWQAGVKFFRPEFLNNYNGTSGHWDVQGLVIEEATDVEAAKDAAGAAQTAANTANAALADIAADNKLTPVEKQSAANEWGIINRERASIQSQADALGILQERWDYDYVYAVLNDYITPLLQDISSTSVIDGATFRDKWSFFYEYRQRLINKMAAVAATKADWSNVQSRPGDEDILNAGKNLCPNPDLLGNLGDSTTAPGWSKATAGAPVYQLRYVPRPASIAPPWDAEQPVFYALTNSADASAYWYSEFIPVDASKVHHLSCYAMSQWGTPNVYLGVECYNAAGTYLGGGNIYVLAGFSGLTTTYQQYGGTIGPGQAANFHVGTTKVRIIWIGAYLQVGGSMATRFCFNEGKVPSKSVLPPNLLGQHNPITTSNVTTYIANAAIGAAQIGSINLVGTSNFAVKTAASGARMDMDSRRIKVFDASGVLRVQLGDLTV